MYPILQTGVKFELCDNECKEPIYIATNSNGDEYEIDRRLYEALLNANGKRPLNLPGKGRKLIPVLEKYGLIQTSRLQLYAGGINLYTVFPIGTVSEKTTKICREINSVLPKASTMILIAGICVRMLATLLGWPVDTESVSLWVYYIGFIVSIMLHEAGHAVSGISSGYEMRDAGILLFFILPIGAYVQCVDEKKDVSKAEAIQFALAGIECNLLIAGICLLASVFKPISMTMLLIAHSNIVLAVSNLIPRDGLDGEKALSALFEYSIVDLAGQYLKSERYRRKLLNSGPAGYACIIILLIALFAKEILKAMYVFVFVYTLIIVNM